ISAEIQSRAHALPPEGSVTFSSLNSGGSHGGENGAKPTTADSKSFLSYTGV
ncbi:unnamed protein product, partial [Allacma fusca]